MNEALEILGLRVGASRAEIKEGYRDLVKVWHPDRFADDPRLRQKAEDKLKQLNDAYETLRSGSVTATANASPTSTPNRPARPRRKAAPPASNAASGRHGTHLGLWFYILVAMLLIALAAYVVRGGEPLSSFHAVHTGSGMVGPSRAPRPEDARPPRTSAVPGSAGQADSAGVHIRGLSDAEVAQIESACGSLQALPDSSEYQSCVNAQLAAITNAAGPPDLSGLSTSERESIESACSADPRLHDRCLTQQMADLAAFPERPQMAGLTDGDRASIEKACAAAKARGPALYNRCRIRFVSLLANSK